MFGFLFNPSCFFSDSLESGSGKQTVSFDFSSFGTALHSWSSWQCAWCHMYSPAGFAFCFVYVENRPPYLSLWPTEYVIYFILLFCIYMCQLVCMYTTCTQMAVAGRRRHWIPREELNLQLSEPLNGAAESRSSRWANSLTWAVSAAPSTGVFYTMISSKVSWEFDLEFI